MCRTGDFRSLLTFPFASRHSVVSRWQAKCFISFRRSLFGIEAFLKNISPEAERERLMRSMLAYLIQHSDAMDTADGIRQWWLPLHKPCSREEVQDVLNELVEKRWLISRGRLEESRLYGLNKERLTEVVEFVSD